MRPLSKAFRATLSYPCQHPPQAPLFHHLALSKVFNRDSDWLDGMFSKDKAPGSSRAGSIRVKE